MFNRKSLNQLALLNKDPHNRAALKLLKPKEVVPEQLHGLTLARLALAKMEPAEQDRLGALLDQLEQLPAREQQAALYGLREGEEVIPAKTLGMLPPREAGELLVRSLM